MTWLSLKHNSMLSHITACSVQVLTKVERNLAAYPFRNYCSSNPNCNLEHAGARKGIVQILGPASTEMGLFFYL